MTFFLETSTILGLITPFSEIVARRSGDLQIMLLAINGNRFVQSKSSSVFHDTLHINTKYKLIATHKSKALSMTTKEPQGL